MTRRAISDQMLARILKDGRATRSERLKGPPRIVRIKPSIPWVEYALCLAVAAFIGVMLAVGGVL